MTAPAPVPAAVVAPARRRLLRILAVTAAVVTVMPIVVATARAIDRGWVAVGDNALFAIRSHEVFTTDPPLLGTWSSGSGAAGFDFNHPGPLLDDLLAVPVRVFAASTGVAIGVAIINALAVIGIAVFAYRRGGALLATIAMAVTACLAWSMGSELLFEPWNPHVTLLPFLCFLVLVWSAVCGDLLAFPLAVAAGSLVAQTHLSYGVLVPLLGLWAVVGLGFWIRTQRSHDPTTWPKLRRRAIGSGAAAVGVFVVCWAQPLIEQLTGDGRGNLSRLADNAGNGSQTTGAGLGVRLVADVIAIPWFWFRPTFRGGSFRTQVSAGRGATVLALVALAVLGAVLVGCAWNARRRRDRDTLMLEVTAVLAVLAGLASAVRAPFGIFGTAAHQFRWLWPLGAFVFLAVLTAGARWLTAGRAQRIVPVVVGFTVVAGVLAVLNVPTSDQGTSSIPGSIAVSRDLNDQLTDVDVEGTVLVDGRTRFADPYSPAVMAELQEQGIPFVIGPNLIPSRQISSRHEFDDSNADATLFVAIGEQASRKPAGFRQVAFHEGLSQDEQRQFATLRTQIRTFIEDGRLRLNRRGREALETGELPVLASSSDGSVDAEQLFESRELVHMIEHDLLALDERWQRRLARFTQLQIQADRRTVALFLGPAPT